MTARAACVLSLLLACAHPAAAQSYPRDAPHAGTLEAAAGGVWVRGIDFGEQRATEMRNPTTGSDPLVLFVSRSRLGGAAGLQARIGMYLTRRIAVEAGLRYSRPVVTTRVTNDFESAADATLEETLSQYVLDGSVVLHLAQFSGGRLVPFVQGGAGQLRDLHERGELLQTSTEYHAGGGVKLWFGQRSHRFGVRAEAAASSRRGGFDLSDVRRTIPTAGASVIFRF